jgi:hypothetical protein
MSKKYLIANIKLPILVNKDGSFTIMDDDIDIQISNYDGPIKRVVNDIVIDKSQLIKKEKNSLNTSFKNKIEKVLKSSRFTHKSFDKL